MVYNNNNDNDNDDKDNLPLQEWTYGLSAGTKQSDHYRGLAISGGLTEWVINPQSIVTFLGS